MPPDIIDLKSSDIKAQLIKEYEINKVSYTSTLISSQRNIWLKKVITEYLKDTYGDHI
jgi:hypothetical protein